jgi:tRNA threonylcarbamoyladenosine biosynthesis protein TsaB
MLILALDTASHLCAAALYDSAADRIAGKAVEDIGRGHAERLMAVIADALREADADYGAIARIAVTVGPGSFTGIRVAVATARGLSLALGVPAVGVTTLEAIAHSAHQEAAHSAHQEAAGREAGTGPRSPTLVAIDASRGELHCQLFANDAGGIDPLSPARALEPRQAAYVASLHHAALAGSGSDAIEAVLAEAGSAALPVLTRARAADISAVARIAAGRVPDGRPTPFYIRSPDAKTQEGFALPRKDKATA